MTSVLSAVELGEVRWNKSTKSGASGCVEVAILPDGDRAVRHSKDPSGPALIFTLVEWEAFIGGVQAHEEGLVISEPSLREIRGQIMTTEETQ
jgi:predicted secreted Zn-dependent protease